MTQTNEQIYHAHGLEEGILFKCPNYTKQSKIQENPYQNISGIFHRTRTNNLKICMKPQKTLNSQSNLEKEQSWRYHAPKLKLYYKAIVIKTV